MRRKRYKRYGRGDMSYDIYAHEKEKDKRDMSRGAKRYMLKRVSIYIWVMIDICVIYIEKEKESRKSSARSIITCAKEWKDIMREWGEREAEEERGTGGARGGRERGRNEVVVVVVCRGAGEVRGREEGGGEGRCERREGRMWGEGRWGGEGEVCAVRSRSRHWRLPPAHSHHVTTVTTVTPVIIIITIIIIIIFVCPPLLCHFHSPSAAHFTILPLSSLHYFSFSLFMLFIILYHHDGIIRSGITHPFFSFLRPSCPRVVVRERWGWGVRVRGEVRGVRVRVRGGWGWGFVRWGEVRGEGREREKVQWEREVCSKRGEKERQAGRQRCRCRWACSRCRSTTRSPHNMS